MDAVRTIRLTKKYKDLTAVDGLDLTVRQGEVMSLLGVNGAGKTTTIKMLTGLTKPTSGNAFLNGKSILTDSAAVKSMIALSPQETAAAPNLTVRENLELMAGVYGFPRSQVRERSAEMIRRFGLVDIAGKKAGRLSGGWQRRLSLAMALVSGPRILFLDEPTLGLDVLARSALWELIRALRGEMTVILTTHYMEEAEALSDRVAVMRGGRLLLTATPEDLKRRAGTDKFDEAFVRIVKEGER